MATAVVRLSISKKALFTILIPFLLFSHVTYTMVEGMGYVNWGEDRLMIEEFDKSEISSKMGVTKTLASSVYSNSTKIFHGGIQKAQISSFSESVSFSRHIMCKDKTAFYEPIDPTTIFKPSDEKAMCLTTAWLSAGEKIMFRWFYRNDSSRTWVFTGFNWSEQAIVDTEYYFAAYLNIAGYWPGSNYPRSYKVDVYLAGAYAFSDFFEVTNGGMNSPRMCEDIINGNPVNVKSRFTINADPEAYHYLKLDKIAYFNQELGCCHNFTTVWIQPDGNTYKRHSASFPDYKDVNITWNYWQQGVSQSDYITINSSTPIGNWKVEVYVDSYLVNNTWRGYGPVATTPFVIGNETVADWTFMIYLDGDNSLEAPAIDIFLKLAEYGSSSKVNIVVQMDRIPYYVDSYGDWTGCMRFNITKGMTPTPGNATLDLGEVNMGHPDTLKSFVNWTMHFFPANYYTLVLWDHGVGFMGFCFDVTAREDFLSLPEVSQALDGLPGIIDVVLFDACSMSMVEIAYQIKDHANILIGPEGVGYAPAPYEGYMLMLTGNASLLPNDFAESIVDWYMVWCKDEDFIQNATISATDLTEITRLMASIENFALTLKDKETPHKSFLLSEHERIISARNLTEKYKGPYENEVNYYVDLYNFAELVRQYSEDKELQSNADQLMTELETVTIKAQNKNRTDSHGLAIFFPDAKRKYERYESEYAKTAFAKESAWNDFLDYHSSAYILTIQTSLPGINIEVEEESSQVKFSNTTDAHGRISMFVPPSNYTINLTATVVPTGPGRRAVFTGWNDNHTSNLRALSVNRTSTLEAEYETQYRLIMNTDFGTTSPSKGEHWYKEHSMLEISTTPPDETQGERYVLLGWTGTGNGSYSNTDNPTYITMHEPINETAVWRHEYLLGVGSTYSSPTPATGWFEAGEFINASVVSPVSGEAGTRYVCTGWTGRGSVSSSGENTSIIFVMTVPSNLTWNWKIQYLLTVNVDPAGIGAQPDISPLGPWYDNGTVINCTSQEIKGYSFDHWNIDGINRDRDEDTMNLTMHGPHEVIVYYTRAIAWWEHTDMLLVLGFLGIVVTAVAVGTTWIRRYKRKKTRKGFEPEIEVPELIPGRIPVGYEDLDKLLLGGLPKNYAVILTSSSCDERDVLIRRFLETGASKGEITFYVTANPGRLKNLAEDFQSNFYLFICNPRANMIIKDLPNVFKLKGVENLTEISIELTKTFERAAVDSITGSKRACIEIVSDVLLQHGAIKIRRWLTDLVTELKSRGFTTLAVMDPQMHSSKEVHAILDLFEGEINIYEREVGARFLRIKKMYNQRYLEWELHLKREGLDDTEKQES